MSEMFDEIARLWDKFMGRPEKTWYERRFREHLAADPSPLARQRLDIENLRIGLTPVVNGWKTQFVDYLEKFQKSLASVKITEAEAESVLPFGRRYRDVAFYFVMRDVGKESFALGGEFMIEISTDQLPGHPAFRDHSLLICRIELKEQKKKKGQRRGPGEKKFKAECSFGVTNVPLAEVESRRGTDNWVVLDEKLADGGSFLMLACRKALVSDGTWLKLLRQTNLVLYRGSQALEGYRATHR